MQYYMWHGMACCYGNENLQRERKPIKMAEPIAGDTPCLCTRPELSEFSLFLNYSDYPTASKGEIIRSWLAVLVYCEVRATV